MRPPTGIMTGQSLWMMPTRSSPGMSAAVNTRHARRARPRPRSVSMPRTSARAWSARSQRGVEHAGRPGGRRRSRGRPAPARVASYFDAAGCRRRPGDGSTATSSPAASSLDGVEDLHVAGAAAQVGAEVAGRVLAGEVRRPSCRAAPWPARRCPGCRSRTAARRVAAKASAKRSRSSSVEALERRDRLARDLGSSGGLAADHGLAVDAAPCSTRTGPTASSRPWAR